MNTDFIFYLQLASGDVLDEIFRTVEDAIEYADEHNLKGYHIIKWSVD